MLVSETRIATYIKVREKRKRRKPIFAAQKTKIGTATRTFDIHPRPLTRRG